eukprot:scaffold30108_cov136-Skeletonema_dohrnii-CCMP3373.AAC.1
MVVAEIDGENEFCFGAQQVKYMPPQRVNPHPRLQQLLERLEECKEEEEEEEEEALTACYPSFFMKLMISLWRKNWDSSLALSFKKKRSRSCLRPPRLSIPSAKLIPGDRYIVTTNNNRERPLSSLLSLRALTPTITTSSNTTTMNTSPPPNVQDPSGAAAAFPPLPSPIMGPAASAQHHAQQQPVQVAAPVAANNEIQVSHQDVLFGRGGQTNRHIGNLRYRDIIALHRADYVRASKVEKPNVARRIVKAIRTGKNPGRFLRKGDDGKWQEVSDKEASWKASQALREKTRWSSMKQQKVAQEIADGSQKANEHAEKVVEKATKS